MTIDISPGAQGRQPARHERRQRARGQSGHRPAVRAATSCTRGDFARVLAEFWADGPKSETPPGHWNVIANEVSDALGSELRIGGTGDPCRPSRVGREALPRAQRRGPRRGDRRLGPQGPLRLGPADLDDPLHGRARASRATRPRPSYDPEGLPLAPGLDRGDHAEDRARPAQRHEALAGHVGEIAIRAWRGNPEDPDDRDERASAGSCAVDWVPYQRRPSSRRRSRASSPGHSTFSRAAAEVLTAFTGSPYFPGGHRRVDEHGGLPEVRARARPTDVTLQWATYYDAADQAGHVAPLRRHPHPGRRLRGPQARRRSAARAWTWRSATSTGRPAAIRRRGHGAARAAACGSAAFPEPYARSAAAKRRSITRRLATASSGGIGAARRPGSRRRTLGLDRVGVGRLERQHLVAGATGGSPPGRDVDVRRPVGRDVERDVDRDPAGRSRRRGPAGRARPGSSR